MTGVRPLLRWIPTGAPGLALAFALWLASALLHRPVSDLLDGYPIQYATYAMYAAALALAAWLGVRSMGGERPWLALAAWGLLVAAAVICHFTLVTIGVEVIHYPQYALVAVLFAHALDAERQNRLVLEVLLIATVLSAVDEALQYLFFMRGQTYFDYNDLLLNQIGVLAGLLLYYGLPGPRSAARRRGLLRWLLVGCFGLVVAIAAALASEVLRVRPDGDFSGGAVATDGGLRVYLQLEARAHGAWRRSRSGGGYYVLGAFGWLVCFLATTMLAGLVERPWPARSVGKERERKTSRLID